jgi:hypothetical protein
MGVCYRQAIEFFEILETNNYFIYLHKNLNNMSKYYTVKGLKVRVSDHEPNFSMDKFRGSNDIELYTKSIDNKKLSIEDQIDRFLETPLAIQEGITKNDFNNVLGRKGKKEDLLKKEYKTIDNWFDNPKNNEELIQDLRTNPNWFMPSYLKKDQKEKWLSYLNKKLNSI